MGAGAPEGNTNAETWTLDKAEELFDKALAFSIGEEYDFIGEIAKACDSYIEIFNYLAKKFPELKPRLKQIRRNCEANCFSNAKKGKINATLAIVNLNSNHNWANRQDITSKGKKLPKPGDNKITVEITKPIEE